MCLLLFWCVLVLVLYVGFVGVVGCLLLLLGRFIYVCCCSNTVRNGVLLHKPSD